MNKNWLIQHKKWFQSHNGKLVETRKTVSFSPKAGTIVTDSYGKKYLVHANGQLTRA